MTVGIMSMQRILNYGSLMQAYSLKQLIESLGHEVEFVDYHVAPTVYNKKLIKEKIKFAFTNCIKKHLPGTKVEFFLKKKLNRFNEHRERFYSFYMRLGLDRKYHYRSNVDTLVIGSDEVFNCLQKGNTVGYSLELFGRRNKANRLISYAASFGSTTMEGLEKYEVKDEVTLHLKKFDDLSVRDKNSFDIVKSLTGYSPMIHLDPVLVGNIEDEEWVPCKEEKFVIVYGYYKRFSEKECRKILSYAHKKGLNVIALGEEQPLYDKFIECRPDELLSYFKNAAFIITDTFHGTIFSIICHKKFVTIPRKSINDIGGNTEKLESLLAAFNLTERACYSLEKIDEIVSLPIDYSYVDSIRNKERERTLEYLKKDLDMPKGTL